MRQRPFVSVMVVAALTGAGGASARPSVADAHVSPAQATKCLKAHGALVQRDPPAVDVMPRAPTIKVSFVLVPGQRHDELVVAFASDHAAAAAAAAHIVKRFERKVPTIRRYLTVKNNALVYWRLPNPSAATRTTVLGCLRGT